MAHDAVDVPTEDEKIGLVCCSLLQWCMVTRHDAMQPSCAQHLRISQELNDDATQLMPGPKQNSLAFSGTARLSNKHPHPTHEATAHECLNHPRSIESWIWKECVP